ncbi:MAG TPA: integrating conjugative element protein, partial [Cellvibrio sp.]|nr:integrating conjugative element protein [Cellvibrio sp.]
MALAKPIVLADFGGRPTELAKIKSIAGAYQASKESSIYERPSQFPLMSKILSVGIVESQKHKLKVITPVFITGVDQLSLEWLSTNQTYLKKIGAKGIVTNIASSSDFEKLKKRVPDLNLNAVPVDQLA